MLEQDPLRTPYGVTVRVALFPFRLYFSAILASAAITAVLFLVVQGPKGGSPPRPVMPPVVAKEYVPTCRAHPRCGNLEGNCCPTNDGVLLDCCEHIESSVKMTPFHAISYAPGPEKLPYAFPTDDFMAPWARNLWGPTTFKSAGRDDLRIIRQLNASAVRLYGNDPRLSHQEFLDRAAEVGLGVIVALSDFPYTQDPEHRCAVAPPYDCFQEIMNQYTDMLVNGFTILQDDGTRRYHPALLAIILVNEPELKITYNGRTDRESRSKGYYNKAIISALDGALSAEQALNVLPDSKGRLPPFTVTYSFDVCRECLSSVRGHRAGGTLVGELAGLGFMYDLVLGALAPATYGYSNARNNLRYGLQNRFALGFNTQDSSNVVCSKLMDPLAQTALGTLPMWTGEFKAWYHSLYDVKAELFEQDLKIMHQFVEGPRACKSSQPLAGVSVFEFQVSYWKGPGDHQMEYGIYELGSMSLGRTEKAEATTWKDWDVWCLRQKRNMFQQSWVATVARVFGGTVPDDSACKAAVVSLV